MLNFALCEGSKRTQLINAREDGDRLKLRIDPLRFQLYLF